MQNLRRIINLHKVLWVSSLLCLAMTGSVSHAAELSKEYKVKAAYLLNILLYLEWADTSPGGTIRVCMDEDADFETFISQVLASKPANFARRPVKLNSVANNAPMPDCHMYFQFAEAHRTLANDCDCLVVGDNRSYRKVDTALNFYMSQGRVRFEVSRQKLNQLGVKMSSRLLRLADVVDQW